MVLAALLLLDDGPAVLIKGEGAHVHEIHAGDMILAGDALEGLGGVDEDALLLALDDLLLIGGHHFPGLQTGQMNLFGAQTHGGAGAVEGHAAAAQDHHPLAHAGLLTQAGLAQEVDVQQHAGQLAAGDGQAHALVGADGHEHRVVLLEQLHRVLHPAVGLHHHALVLDDLGLFRHNVPGQAVAGDAVGHHAAHGGQGLLQEYGVALLAQVVGRGEAGGAAAHHAHLLPGVRQLLALALPVLPGVVLRGVPLDVADGHGLIDLAPLALPLAGVGAHIAQGLGEGDGLPDHGGSRVVIALFHKADVPGNVGVGGAGGPAGDDGVLPLHADHLLLVPDGAGGAHLGTGGAEPAVRVGQQFVVQGSHVGLQILLPVVQNPHAPQVPAGPHAAAAQDAAVHVVDEQGVALLRLHAPVPGSHPGVVGADVLDQGLQLAVAVLRAGGAVLRMTCQQQLQGQGAQLVDPLALGADDHAVLCLEQAGLHHALLPLHLHDAHPAGPVLRQVRVVAQVGNVDPRFQGAFQHILLVGHTQRAPVDGDDRHGVFLLPCFGRLDKCQTN